MIMIVGKLCQALLLVRMRPRHPNDPGDRTQQACPINQLIQGVTLLMILGRRMEIGGCDKELVRVAQGKLSSAAVLCSSDS